MKTVWIAAVAVTVSTSVLAQSTIYKHVDESGRITYSNKPIKGATVMELEPLTTIPATPAGSLQKPAQAPAEARAEMRPAVAIVTPLPAKQTVASVDPQLQKRRDDERRRILEQELKQEQESMAKVRGLLAEEQQNPTLVAAVRVAQQATEPTPAQMLEMRQNIDKASSRIRGLQATIAEHEKNVEALKKELGALKP